MVDWNEVCKEATVLGKMFTTRTVLDYVREHNLTDTSDGSVRNHVDRVLRNGEKYGIYKLVQKKSYNKPNVWIRVL